MRSKLRNHGLILTAMLCTAGTASAVDYKAEYDQKIKVSQNISTLGNDLAGDKVNLQTGAVTFSATDVSLPGNNALPVEVTRTYSVDFDNAGFSDFGDWDLATPYISAVMTEQYGWVVNSSTPNKRCSSGYAPPTVTVPEDEGSAGGPAPQYHGFFASDYWHGNTLVTPSGSQTMLAATETQRPTPTPGETYYWNTNQDWWISCLPVSASAGNGEGFKAISPDGIKYFFDQLGGRSAPELEATDDWSDEPGTRPVSFHFTLPRAEWRLYASKVEDRFGNWVQYNRTNGVLTSISSSDGRTITITRSGNEISSITDGTRTWTYIYATTAWGSRSLQQVTLPDGSGWYYSFQAMSTLHRPGAQCNPSGPGGGIQAFYCWGGGYLAGGATTSGFVIHPSGARVDFSFDAHFQFSINAPNYGSWPLAMTQKTLSGPGITSATWRYGSYPDVNTTESMCHASTTGTTDHCPQYVVSEEWGPDGAFTRRVYDMNSLQQGEFRGNTSGSAPSGGTARITTSARWGTSYIGDVSPLSGSVPAFYQEMDTRYVTDNNPGYTVKVGNNLLLGVADVYVSERRLPQKTTTLTQQNATFTRNVDSFDTYAHPMKVTSSSSGLAGPANSYSRSETTAYYNNISKWVIGQVASVQDFATSKYISRTTYDTALALPIENYAFEKLKEALTYNADGTIATVRDGRNSVITLANWKRGVPGLIKYPTVVGQATPFVSESAVISDIGTLTSTTDELSFTTSYGYDAMGRLSGITYPTADTTNWNPLSRGFVRVLTTEYGVDPGHWKQTVQTGDGKTTTLYDAQFRPVLTITEDSGTGWKSFVVKRYDSSGHEIFSSYPVSSLTSVNDSLTGVTTTFDVLDRPVQVSQASELGALNTSTEYLAGFLTRITNPRTVQSTTSYQVFDQPKTDAPVKIVNGVGLPEQQTTTITRDGFGKPLTITRGTN